VVLVVEEASIGVFPSLVEVTPAHCTTKETGNPVTLLQGRNYGCQKSSSSSRKRNNRRAKKRRENIFTVVLLGNDFTIATVMGEDQWLRNMFRSTVKVDVKKTFVDIFRLNRRYGILLCVGQ